MFYIIMHVSVCNTFDYLILSIQHGGPFNFFFFVVLVCILCLIIFVSNLTSEPMLSYGFLKC